MCPVCGEVTCEGEEVGMRVQCWTSFLTVLTKEGSRGQNIWRSCRVESSAGRSSSEADCSRSKYLPEPGVGGPDTRCLRQLRGKLKSTSRRVLGLSLLSPYRVLFIFKQWPELFSLSLELSLSFSQLRM